jgi:hypothetical protein
MSIQDGSKDRGDREPEVAPTEWEDLHAELFQWLDSHLPTSCNYAAGKVSVAPRPVCAETTAIRKLRTSKGTDVLHSPGGGVR